VTDGADVLAVVAHYDLGCLVGDGIAVRIDHTDGQPHEFIAVVRGFLEGDLQGEVNARDSGFRSAVEEAADDAAEGDDHHHCTKGQHGAAAAGRAPLRLLTAPLPRRRHGADADSLPARSWRQIA